MRLSTIITILFVGTLGLAACQKTPVIAPVADAKTLRHIESGDLVGSITSPAGAYQWAAIPYAAPPVGDLRWRAPRPAAKWDGQRPALDLSVRCVQRARTADINDDLGKMVGAEDCLVLNVWTPAFSADALPKEDARLPVMFFIHGGSNVWGYGGQYDGQYLATRHNMVIVSINYRLGPFGWFAHSALRQSALSGPDQSPNFATLDMIAALKWVKRNIGNFGGNPDRVTIFGESAGGQDVASLIALPRAQGLFKGAIIQSGYFTTLSLDEAENGVPKGTGWVYKGARATVAALNPPQGMNGPDLAAFLRDTPANDLYKASQEDGETEPGSPLIIADNILLKAPSLEAALENPGFERVPVITGTNRDETKLFNVTNPKLVKKFLGFLPRPRDARTYALQAEYESAMWRARSVDSQARRMRAAGPSPVYAYRFDWDEEGAFMGTDFSLLLGAGHAMELPFVFNGFETFPVGSGHIFPKAKAEARNTLSHAMMSYWAAFATNGAPGRGMDGNLPEWKSWGDGQARLMILDTTDGGGVRMSDKAVSVDSVLETLQKDTRFESLKEKCMAFLGVKGWFPEISAQVRQFAHVDCKL
jgi:para-nitrobenzyl esterase